MTRRTRQSAFVRLRLTALAAAVAIALGLLSYAGSTHPRHALAQPPDADAPPPMRVGRLVYAGGQTSVCFSSGFLEVVDRETSLRVHRRLIDVPLADADAVFAHPFLIMSGEGAFTATTAEAEILGAYLRRGGFLLASAGCSDEKWDAAFRDLLAAALPGARLRPMTIDEPPFQMLYELDAFRTVKRTEQVLFAIELDEKMVGVYSPIGLNDSANMGAACCCCGANEVRNARLVNASLLIHAVTHP